MVFYINKQAIEIKARFENAPLTSTNECCCVVGILAKIYGLPLPSEYAGKIIKLFDDYYKPGSISDELYELLKYAYDEQVGTEPAYKPPTSNRM